MKVEPISEAEAAAPGLWPRGIYDFEVVEAKERESKSGNEMIELLVKIYDTQGKSRTIFDYLVAIESMSYKVRHFASATGMLAAYEKGELRAIDCEGRTGKCQVVVQKSKDTFPDKNAISDYVPVIAGQPLVTSAAPEDDEIPF